MSLTQSPPVGAAQLVLARRRGDAQHLICIGGYRTIVHPVENTGWEL
jgi:hypothetical protein